MKRLMDFSYNKFMGQYPEINSVKHGQLSAKPSKVSQNKPKTILSS